MGLTITQLLPDYRASLNDARIVFGTDDSDQQKQNLTRHLNMAAQKLALGKRPRTRQGTLSLMAGQWAYASVPADLMLPKVSIWGLTNLAPWCLPQGPLPILTLGEDETGARVLNLNPPPTLSQIQTFGSSYPYYYFAAHAITDDANTSTLQEKDRALVILGAQVEAMRETAVRNAHKPVSLRDAGGNGQTRNMTPSALFTLLLQEFNEAT